MKYGVIIKWLFIALVLVFALWLIVNVEAHAATCVDVDTRERLRTLQTEAINEAYKDRVRHLFEIWMKDSSDQPARARVGITQATEAYIHARNAALKWNPLIC